MFADFLTRCLLKLLDLGTVFEESYYEEVNQLRYRQRWALVSGVAALILFVLALVVEPSDQLAANSLIGAMVAPTLKTLAEVMLACGIVSSLVSLYAAYRADKFVATGE